MSFAPSNGYRAGECSSSGTASWDDCSERFCDAAATRRAPSTPIPDATRATRKAASTRRCSPRQAGRRRRPRPSFRAARLLVFAPSAPLGLDAVYRRELTVLGSRSATPRHMREAIALLPELDLPEATVLPLERFDEGLELYRSGEAVKVVFTP